MIIASDSLPVHTLPQPPTHLQMLRTTSLALATTLAAAAATTVSAQDKPLTAPQAAARAIYQEIVEINTVDSVGSTTKAAEAIAARFRAAGFPAADVQLLIPDNAPTKGNLVVRYRGKGQGKPILLLAHLDVVGAGA